MTFRGHYKWDRSEVPRAHDEVANFAKKRNSSSCFYRQELGRNNHLRSVLGEVAFPIIQNRFRDIVHWPFDIEALHDLNEFAADARVWWWEVGDRIVVAAQVKHPGCEQLRRDAIVDHQVGDDGHGQREQRLEKLGIFSTVHKLL